MTRIIALALTTIVLLTSCGSKFSLMKRKYTKGFYISSSKGRDSNKNETAAKSKAQPNKHIIADAPATDPNITFEVATESVRALSEQGGADLVQHKKMLEPAEKRLTANATTLKPNRTLTPASAHIRPINLPKPQKTHSKKDDTSDIKLILLVILCIFWWLDLLAVYIHDGKKITMNFWITLLLDLLVIVGIVFAILVVLDLIDVK